MTVPTITPPPPSGPALPTLREVSNDVTSPAFTCKAYREQRPRWDLCADMLGGTDYVQGKGEVYLPKAPAEKPDEYTRRVRRSEFFNMFEETISGLVGMIMRKEITFEESAPQELIDMAEDVDGMGTGLNIWSRHQLFDSMARGHIGLLCDYPSVQDGISVAERRSRKLRPYFVAYQPENILSWRTVVEDGKLVLRQIVLREVSIIENGEFGEQEQVRYRRYRREKFPTGPEVTVQVYQRVGAQKLGSLGPASTVYANGKPIDVIPFTVHYSGVRLAYLYTKPPLLELAYTNIAHYQVQSDHRTALHMSSNPILITKGLRKGTTQVLGATIGLEVGKDGDAKYIEPTGGALSQTRAELDSLEARAASQGLAMLKRETRAAETATAKRLDKSEQESKLSLAAKNWEDCIEQLFGWAATFEGLVAVGEATDEGPSLVVNQDFSDLVFEPDMIRALNEVVAANNLTRGTFWDLLKKGSILPESFDATKEEQELTKQSDTAAILQQVNASAQQRAFGLTGQQPPGGFGPDGKPVPPNPKATPMPPGMRGAAA